MCERRRCGPIRDVLGSCSTRFHPAPWIFGDALAAVPTGLDVAGLIPGAGEPLEGRNALMSLTRGETVGAAVAIVPGAGMGATTRADGIIELRGALHEYAGE